MPSVIARDEESIDSLMRRFKRTVEKAGIPKEVRKREFHQKRSQVKQRELAAARKRHLKRLAREKAMWEGLQGHMSTKRGSSSGSSSRGRGRK